MTDKKPNTDLNTEIVCRCVEAVLMDLRDKGGIGTAEILAAAHAQTVTMLACFIGGEAAAERCLAAAERVRSIPSYRDAALAAVEPKGRA